MRKIGIVGCGAIGSFLAQYIDKNFQNKSKIVGLADIDVKKARLLSCSLKSKPAVLNLERLIQTSDLIIEAASSKASYRIASAALTAGKDVMVMSVGGLVGRERIFGLAKKKDRSIYFPSGAIAGLDALKAAAIGRIDKVVLTTRKSPRSLTGAPFIRKNKIELDKIRKETVLFNGTARQAVKAFPQNINVAATLSLAGIGINRTRVRIICSPKFRHNIHELEIVGDFGRITMRTENIPSRTNPKTSFLAMLSAAAMLRQVLNNIKIGT